MDSHSLNRKELQSLCKIHKIPANLTNLAMADALSALDLVDGVQNTEISMPETAVASRKPIARKPQSDLIDNEPKIQAGLARSRRAPLHGNSSTSEEAIILKTSAPRTCQEKAVGELVSKAKESNNGKEMEVPVITRRSTRVQQKSKLKKTEHVLKVGGINEADMLSVKVNVVQKKSQSEVADDVQQKLDGTNGNSSKEEHDDVVSRNVDGVEKTGKSVLDIPTASRKSIARKPQPELIDNEPRICVGLARPRRVTFLKKSSATEDAIIPESSAPQTCLEKAARELVSKAKESNNGKETEVLGITRRSTRVQQKSKLKRTEHVLKVGGIKEADMLSVEVNVDQIKSLSEVADDVQQKLDGKPTAKEEHDDVVSRNVDGVKKTGKSMLDIPTTSRKSIARKPQPELIDNEPRVCVNLARPRRVTFLEKSSATEESIIPETSAPQTCQEKAAQELVSKTKESNNGREIEVPVITRRSTRVQQKSELKRTEPVLKVGGIKEADMLSVEVNVDQMKSEFEVADDVQQKLDGKPTAKEEHDDVVSGNVNGVETTRKSMLNILITSRKSILRKPQPELIDNEPRIRVGLAKPRRVTFLEKSSATEEAIIAKTSAPLTCEEKVAGELVSKTKESNNGKETEVPVITRRSTRVQQKSKLKITEPVLKKGGKNEAEMSVEVNVDKLKPEFEVTDVDQQKND
ncbi:hypothetical protein MKW94_011202, partial [Papaver nudicaule]|nr:hypothetical protein [Papaver nudicaule]